MTATEILSALKLKKGKFTSAFAGKLASYFAFVKQIKADVVEAEITASNLTVTEAGQLIEISALRQDYIASKVVSFKNKDKEYKALSKENSDLYQQIQELNADIYRARKQKKEDAENLQEKVNSLNREITANKEFKKILVEAEEKRLRESSFTNDEMRKELNLLKASTLTVKTKGGGVYRFVCPVANKFYYALCNLLGLQSELDKVEQVKPIQQIVTTDSFIDKFKKASKFVAKDELRPAMMCVCLDFSKKGLQIVATDAHRMYYSSYLDADINDGNGWQNTKSFNKNDGFQLLVKPESFQAVLKSKVDRSEPIYINVYSDEAATINGVEVNLFTDGKYPNYRVVIPKYKRKMVFYREDLKEAVKEVVVYANKSTNQVEFNLSGEITLSSQDVDFSNESVRRMNYIKKEFPDAHIGFNGQFVIASLDSFSTDQLSMYTDGIANKAVIFTDETDKVLLMPLMLYDWKNY